MTDLEENLRRHVAALSVEIGERTPLKPEKLARAADYVRDAFAGAGFRVTECKRLIRNGAGQMRVVVRPGRR